MTYFDLLFSPKGTIKPQPFAIIVAAIYLTNIVAGSIVDGQFVRRVGPWPYFALQSLLTWIWFAAHAKRLRDAGRGYAIAATIACIYLLCAGLFMSFLEDTAAASLDGEATESVMSLIGTAIAIVFVSALFTGSYSLIGLLLFLFVGLPLLFAVFVLLYSIVTGMRASADAQSALPVAPSLPPPPAQSSRSPVA